MNHIKKILGYVWMALAPAIICFLMYEAYVKIGIAKPAERANTILQWVIILIIFGKYAAANEYAHLPETSDELKD